ncbi:thiolase family protein [Paraburkholderia sp. BCC1886]|uniref:thiolase family protein n=1 Tax=Paraburkholderia sp. BCC1886 TaxID=2562670 RepID=UPI001182D97D|nr:thiolase family protein [Paraburkholderia sp. BCC1886]
MTQALLNEPAVAGIGTTRYGKLPDYDIYELAQWALKDALDDCGLTYADLDGLIVNRIPSYSHLADQCGINPDYVLSTPGHGRFSGICIQTAAHLISSGAVNTIALVYANDGGSAGISYGGDASQFGGAAGAYGGADSHWTPYGMTSPGAFHALMMQRHMHLYGTKSEDLGEIAKTFRHHASLNPAAVMREEFTIEQYMQSRFICDPLRLLDYCLINDGAVAMIMTSGSRSRDLRKPPVYVRGVAQASDFTDSSFPPEDFWSGAMNRVATKVHGMAGTTNDDMSGLMIYDNFTPTVLVSLEGFGFCPVGESGRWVNEGHLRLGQRFPTNTNGGHLSESYLQGWGLNVEAVRQLRGECDARQIDSPAFIQYMAATPITTSIIYGKDSK